MTNDEAWKPVPGYAGLYEISDEGRVRSLDRAVENNGGVQRVRGKILRAVPRNGYGRVSLSKSGEVRKVDVHRLVLETFVGPCPEGLEACHGNGDPEDNRLENLRWDTPSENNYDQVRHGTHPGASKTECKKGHPLSGDNLYINATSGQRVCKTCQREYMAGYMRDRRKREKDGGVDSE